MPDRLQQDVPDMVWEALIGPKHYALITYVPVVSVTRRPDGATIKVKDTTGTYRYFRVRVTECTSAD